MPELMDFIRHFPFDAGRLPLVHMTDKFTLQLIRNSKKLEASDDKVYSGEKLVYMFYGRPSFRPNANVGSTQASYFAPVCLIFDRSIASQAWRVMPFDTGAHAAGLLKETIHKRMDLDEFGLEIDIDAPMKLISCFYGTEEGYLENQPLLPGPDILHIQQQQKHYVEAYYHLLHHRSNSSLDDRANAIEFQFNKDIEINGNLHSVIIPSRHFVSDVVKQIENELGARCIMYDMPASYKPLELMNTIYEKVLVSLTEGTKVARRR